MEVEILRPNAAGDETNITAQFPDSTFHWDKVDEALSDDDATYVKHTEYAYSGDLYNLPASSGHGVISKIVVFFRIKMETEGAEFPGWGRAYIKTLGVTDTGAVKRPDLGEWSPYFEEWAQNPANAHSWTWEEIDALQIGIQMRAYTGGEMRCTQVYVNIDYEIPVGRSHGYIIG